MPMADLLRALVRGGDPNAIASFQINRDRRGGEPYRPISLALMSGAASNPTKPPRKKPKTSLAATLASPFVPRERPMRESMGERVPTQMMPQPRPTMPEPQSGAGAVGVGATAPALTPEAIQDAYRRRQQALAAPAQTSQSTPTPPAVAEAAAIVGTEGTETAQGSAAADTLLTFADSVSPGEWEGVDPRLRAIIEETARRTNARVRVVSGKEPRKRGGDHPRGRSVDFELVAPDGSPIPMGHTGMPGYGGKQTAENFRTYEEFAKAARAVQQEQYPDLDDQFRFGGYYWNGGPGTYGNLDTMELNINPSGAMAGGSWDTGLFPDKMAALQAAGYNIGGRSLAEIYGQPSMAGGGANETMIGSAGSDAVMPQGGAPPAPDRRRAIAEMLAAGADAMNQPVSPIGAQGMAPGPVMTDEATAQPLVADNPRVRQIGFQPQVGPDEIARRRGMAEAMMSAGMSDSGPMLSPWQGAAQMARTGVGALGTIMADRQERDYNRRLAEALTGYYGGGDASRLAGVSPDLYASVMENERARQAQAADFDRRRQASLADYEQRKQIDQRYQEPDERWEDIETLKDGRIVQRNAVTGEIKVSGAVGNNLTIEANETELDKAFVKIAAEGFSGASQARQNLGRITALRDSLSRVQDEGISSGLRSVAASWGLNVGEDTTDIQVAQALINQLVPLQRPPGSGQMSDRDVELFKSSLPSLWQQAGARNVLLDTMQAMAELQRDEAEIFGQFLIDGDRTRAIEALQSLGDPMERFRRLRGVETPPAGYAPEDWAELTLEEREAVVEAMR